MKFSEFLNNLNYPPFYIIIEIFDEFVYSFYLSLMIVTDLIYLFLPSCKRLKKIICLVFCWNIFKELGFRLILTSGWIIYNKKFLLIIFSVINILDHLQIYGWWVPIQKNIFYLLYNFKFPEEFYCICFFVIFLFTFIFKILNFFCNFTKFLMMDVDICPYFLDLDCCFFNYFVVLFSFFFLFHELGFIVFFLIS